MGIEVIDGTVGDAIVKKKAATTILYESITIKTTEGPEIQLDKVAVAPEVAAALQPGTEGRFYGYKAIDHRGLFGMRTRDGRSAFAIPTGNEQIMMMMTFAGLGAFIVFVLLGKPVALLALALGGLGAFAYFKYRSTRMEGRARFDADSDYAGRIA
ncbi:MAG TPA: hypothetical protein VFQ67_03480 [Allosphingosinicella sp.]|jgi:hypothetical protein|nr:hypothetical protein [Allosphingosinicella sp.]